MSKLLEASIERDRIRFGILTPAEQKNPALVKEKLEAAETILRPAKKVGRK